jgi:surface protein
MNKNKVFFIIFALCASMQVGFSNQAYATIIPFVTSWKTDNAGTSNSTSITIPTIGTGYNYDIDWNNDGTYDQFGATGSVTHDYGTAGTYTIAIKGSFPRIYFNNGGDKSKILSVQQWGSIAWTSMANAFMGCNNLMINASDSPILTGVTDISYMFKFATSLNQDISTWNTSTVTNMNNTFAGATAFNQNIGAWNVAAVTAMSGMFQNAAAFNGNIGAWNVGKVTNFSFMFDGASAFNQNIGAWNINILSAVNMGIMFRNATAFNQNIGAWNVSNVRNMGSMFHNAVAFNQNIGAWNVGVVTDIGNMFRNATAFNQNIGAWNVGAVTRMGFMFQNATAFNQNIGAWNVGNVYEMDYMFAGATAFNQNIGAWNVGSVGSCSSMFAGATAFNQNIGAWNVGSVTDMSNMFKNATAFNQNIGTWNTSAVGGMDEMFSGATAFNQNLGTWDITNANLGNIFYNSGISRGNYDAMLIAWNNAGYANKDLGDVSPLEYCGGAAARTNMINNINWGMTGDVFNCTCIPNSSTRSTTICSTQLPYVYFGKTFTTAGNDTLKRTNYGGCDSIVNLSVIVNTPTTWYKDIDNDGYGDASNTQTACVKPIDCVTDNTDVDDADGTVWRNGTFYTDADGDGYDDGSGTAVLAYGTGAPFHRSFTTNGSDCNDFDNTKWRTAVLYIDADGDGYDNSTATVCYGNAIPSGYKTTTLGSDCNDANMSQYIYGTVYIDYDQDGYDVGSTTLCYSLGMLAVNGYSLTTSGTDCDDNNSSIHGGSTYYADTDHDGYGSALVSQIACTQPIGYVTNNVDNNDNSALLTKVQNSQCGIALSSFATAVICNAATGVTGYKFKITDSLNNVQFITSTNRWFYFSQLTGYKYNYRYKVEVAVLLSGIYSNYGAVCYVTSGPIPPSKVQSSQCGITLPTITTAVICDAVVGAAGYKFKITDSLNNVQFISSINRWFYFNQLRTFKYNYRYKVEVAVLIGGVYSNYGAVCYVTSGPIPPTKVQSSQCGITLPTITTAVICDEVIGASGYKFRITDSLNTVQIYTATKRWFYFSQLTTFKYNYRYKVEAVALLNGVYGNYGAACYVATGIIPATKIQSSQCGIAVSNLTTTVYCDAVTGATNYKFSIYRNGVTQIIVSSSRWFKFSQVSGATNNQTYWVKVAAKHGSVYAPYGDSCEVSTPITASSRIRKNDAANNSVNSVSTEAISNANLTSNQLVVNVSPNPAYGEVKINYQLPINTAATTAMITVRDITGKIVQSQFIENTSASGDVSLDLSQVNDGVYFVTLTINEFVETKKLVVQK